MSNPDGKDFETIRKNLLGRLTLHSGELMDIHMDIDEQSAKNISPHESKNLDELHEMIYHLNKRVRSAITALHQDIKQADRRKHIRRVK
jgi:hypothetical protein